VTKLKLKLIASAAILTTAMLTSISLAELVNAQNFTGKEHSAIDLNQQQKEKIDPRNKQRYYDERRSYGGRSRYDNEINQLYREVLGRNADGEGLRTWSRQLERGKSLREIRRDLAYSREAENAINNIYRQVLGRNSDRNGLRNWQRELAEGKSLREVRRSIAGSREGREQRF